MFYLMVNLHQFHTKKYDFDICKRFFDEKNGLNLPSFEDFFVKIARFLS